MDSIISLINTIEQSGIAENGALNIVLAVALVGAGISLNWRFSVLALAVIGVCEMLLLFGQVSPLLAAVRLIVGICVVVILGSAAWPQRNEWRLHWPRVGLVLGSLLVVYALVQSDGLQLPMAQSLTFAVYSLIVIGVGLLVSADHLLHSIIGLFLLLIGSDLIVAAVTHSTTFTLVFVALQIVLALITSWIATPPMPRRRPY